MEAEALLLCAEEPAVDPVLKQEVQSTTFHPFFKNPFYLSLSHVCLGVQSDLNHSHKQNNAALIKIVHFSKTELL
jgi:hypothetical protein